MTKVDQSLARGAARTALRELMEETAKGVGRDNTRVGGKGKKARRSHLVSKLVERLKPLALHLAHDASIGYGGGVASITLATFQSHAAKVEHGVIWGTRNSKMLSILQCVRIKITEHALQRINQRLALLDARGVREAFKFPSLMLVLIAYSLVTKYKDVRQISIPFFGGAFRCDVSDGASIEIKTYVPEPAKWEAELVSDLNAIYTSITPTDIELLLWLPYAAYVAQHAKANKFAKTTLDRSVEVSELLEKVLRKYDWVTKPYAERLDPIGDVWDGARADQEFLESKEPGLIFPK